MKDIKPLTTTVIGSYPVSKFSGFEAIKYAVESQIKAGIDLITDGQTRKDMISYYADHIPGFEYEGDKLKIVDKIEPPVDTPIVEDLKYVISLLPKGTMLKALLTGPVTLISSAKVDKRSPYNGFLDKKLYVDLGEALKREAELLLNAGASFLQIDEPFYSVGAPLNLGMISIEIITENLKVPVGMHVCGNITRVFEKLVLFPGIDVLSLEFAATAENFSVIKRDLLVKNNKMLGVGCVNSQSNIVEDQADILKLLKKAIEIVGVENIIVHPDCGLRLLEPTSAFKKLENMVKATRDIIK
ncbi:MAG: methionine synthase [Candidatus Odinarchaeia archaeon]